MSLSKEDRFIIEMSVRNVTRPAPKLILLIHREGIRRAERELVKIRKTIPVHERTIAMRTLALELLGEQQ